MHINISTLKQSSKNNFNQSLEQCKTLYPHQFMSTLLDVDSFPLLVSGDPVVLLGDLLVLVQDSACLQPLPVLLH